jgi:heme A synthase
VLFQIGLGALTVLHRVPISLASLHQVNAVLLFGCAVGLLHRCRDAGSESS